MELLVLLLAILLDILISEPPLAIHPVSWFGKLISFFEKLKISNPVADLVYGIFSTLTVAFFSLILVFVPIPQPWNYMWHSYLLFSAVSIRSMISHAERCVRDGIDRNAVQQIVSRNTAELNEEQLCSAVIESVAENYVDGVVSPLFYFSILGIGGAMVYKAVNTCDAMIGYRMGRYEHFGKFTARIDDILNFLPARLSLVFFELVKRGALRYGLEKNVKLNGCTIAAMSYVLGVKLEKPGHYMLPGRDADVSLVREAIKAFRVLSAIAVAFFVFVTAIRIMLLTHL
ncbi:MULTISPECIES: adenosylcobinamide-phosphate synthase CbiB [unclassified Archaeoglobus]|jgi:adenosylcobinamide-phosphate synthase|uniref:adenosylcobinamide-phosphate synthase CbiB n=1 Tax=unclassified Archaeoglobus TaxID=2643606 RepID=UPI0025C5DE69|nr:MULTISPECIES: adenosylcobinamide-phosphate synthase CbiB [unclassified Archaeoglobus]